MPCGFFLLLQIYPAFLSLEKTGLFDRLRLSCKDADEETIIKMNNLAAAIYMTSEGVPFMSAGEEMLRTKTNKDGTYNSNSYNAGDSVNTLKWSTLEEE